MSIAHGVLMPGFPGTHLPSWIEDALQAGLAGVILFAENVPDLTTATALTRTIHQLNPGAVISADEEGGDVTRLQAQEGSSLPGNAALGAIDDVELSFQVGKTYGELISQVGIDLALSPNLDVASEPCNPVIGVRSFGASPMLVAQHGHAFAQGLHHAGVSSCGKHFPGHGATTQDSHLDLPRLDASLELMHLRDIPPFVHAQTDAIMTGHLHLPAIGPEPASLTSWTYKQIRHLGHEGPILTDALGMRAITNSYEIGEACVRALEAGADLLLLDAPHMRNAEEDFIIAVRAIEHAVTRGRLKEEHLQKSAKRNALLRHGKQSATPANRSSSHTLQRLSQLGWEIATRALNTVGDVRAHDPIAIIDVRQHVSYAIEESQNPLMVAFTQAGANASLWPLGVEIDQHRQVVILTRNALGNKAENQMLHEALRCHPEAIVMHVGTVSAAPFATRLINTHGSGRPNLLAAVHRILGTHP